MKRRLQRVAVMLAILLAVCGAVSLLHWGLSIVRFGEVRGGTVSVEGAAPAPLTPAQAADLTGWLRRTGAKWNRELGSRPPAPAAVLEFDGAQGKHWRVLLFSLPGWRNTVLAADAQHLKAPLNRLLTDREREELWGIVAPPPH
ncbi:MAG: hypothetical protein PW734_11640 [Verrucomicrobium sp.]|nr:hypothetical protein [Verrucomicrobium sp.]